MEEHIQNALMNVLAEIQQLNGQSASTISPSTCPLTDLQGFDSLNAVEATVILSEKLSYDLRPELMFPASGGSPPNIAEISKRAAQAMQMSKGETK